MRYSRIWAVFFFFLAVAVSGFAQDLGSFSQRSAGDIEGVVWMKPHHFGNTPQGYSFILQNAGGGVRYYIWTNRSDGGAEVFADLNKFFSTETMGSATTLRLAYQKSVVTVGQAKVFVGLVGEAIHYYNSVFIKSHVTGGINPIVTLRYKRASISAAYTLPFTQGGEKYPAMITANIAFRF